MLLLELKILVMNDVFIIALLLVMEDKKWRNIFYLEDVS